MKKRLLSALLAVCMVMTMAPAAFAVEPVADKAVTLTQGDTVQQFDTLQAAIDTVQPYNYSTNKELYTIALNQDLTESVGDSGKVA